MFSLFSERLILREHTDNDLSGYHDVFSDAEVMSFVPGMHSMCIEDTKTRLNKSIAAIYEKNRKTFYFAIVFAENNEYIGDIGLTITKECEEGNLMDLGFFVRKMHWGNGYASEAARMLVGYAFEQLSAVKIEAGCIKENSKSEAVMKKIGFTLEAELRKHSVLNGVLYSRLIYGMTKQEWLEKNG